MDTDLKAELLLAGGYQSPVTPALTRRILAWEQVCTRRDPGQGEGRPRGFAGVGAR